MTCAPRASTAAWCASWPEGGGCWAAAPASADGPIVALSAVTSVTRGRARRIMAAGLLPARRGRVQPGTVPRSTAVAPQRPEGDRVAERVDGRDAVLVGAARLAGDQVDRARRER